MGELRSSQVGTDAASTATAPDQAATPVEVDSVATAKSSKAPAFQFYPKDFLGSSSVGRMSLEAIGAYTLLLCYAWLDKGLPTETEELARLARLPHRQFLKMWSGPLGKCFTQRSGKLVNDRQEDERRKQKEFRDKQAKNGEQGGRPKKSKPDVTQNNPGLSSGLQEHEPRKSSSSPISDLQSPTSVRTRPAPLTARRRLDAFVELGRVWVPQRIHTDFVAERNHPDAEGELLAWYQDVADFWTTGPNGTASTGGDMFEFWRKRFKEKWPAAPSVKQAPSPGDAWRPEAV